MITAAENVLEPNGVRRSFFSRNPEVFSKRRLQDGSQGVERLPNACDRGHACKLRELFDILGTVPRVARLAAPVPLVQYAVQAWACLVCRTLPKVISRSTVVSVWQMFNSTAAIMETAISLID